MSISHIIALAACIVFCFAAIAIVLTREKTSLISKETDFFTDFVTMKKIELTRLGIGMSINVYIALMIACPIVLGAVIYMVTDSGGAAVITALVSIALPELIVRIIYNMTQDKFDERYGRSLQQLSSSLRAGMSILESVRDVATCKFVHESLQKMYASMAMDLEMGIPVSEAFMRFAENTKSKDAMDVAISIDVQNEVGGHEAEVVESIADNISQRIMMRKEVKSIFAGTTSMVWMMDFIPIIVIVYYSITNSSVTDFFFQDVLHIAGFIAIIICLVIGSIVNHGMLRHLELQE